MKKVKLPSYFTGKSNTDLIELQSQNTMEVAMILKQRAIRIEKSLLSKKS